MNTAIERQVALVTGASRGIGAAIALELAHKGFKVIGTATTPEGAARISGALANHEGCKGATLDVNDSAAGQALIDSLVKEHGGLQVLVNNAGITRDTTMKRMDHAKWQEVIDTNLGGCFNMAKAVFEGMQSRGYGRIVNIGSINGQAGQYGQVNYAAAKSGIHGFTKALAQEGARNNVTVNAIAPGYIDTDMVAAVPEEVLAKIVARIPVNRLGKADEIARGVAFLVDENAGFVTGSTLSINGGQHMY
jgi:acetoacetyl-CoA reductase